MSKTKFSVRALSWALALVMLAALLPAGVLAADAGEVYVLMNIPYQAFYNAADVSNQEFAYDAVTSATNKVGNYGKAGGAFHPEQTAETAADGTVTAVGGANGATLQGVIWPVQVSDVSVLETLGGVEIKDSDTKTVATLGRGATSSTDLAGYETLMEAPAYSYYVLTETPDNYMKLAVDGGNVSVTAGTEAAAQKTAITPTAAYGSNWGDVQLSISGVDEVSDLLINGVVITAKDSSGEETRVGLVHLGNVWSATEMAWRVATVQGLDGKEITNIRYYCTVKDSDLADDSVPAYANYVYDYPVTGLSIPSVYTGTVTAAFDSSSSITLTGLPEGAQNLKAKVYYTTGGRNPSYTYLTPLEVDSADDDIDPVTVDIVDGKIAIKAGSVTNNAGTTVEYGKPVNGTEYTIEISSDNYIIGNVTAVYTAKLSDRFRDVKDNAWYSGYVLAAVERGLIYGTGETTFSPNAPATRGVMMTILARLDGADTAGSKPWYQKSVEWAVAEGVSDGTYPEKAITREQVAAMLYRYAGSTGADRSVLESFPDAQNISSWAKDAMAWAVANGIIVGSDGQLKPSGSASRAEAVAMLMRFCDKFDK